MKFALAGNPNCGKTTLFNGLTGSTAHVGNWPGVTVDKREGLYKRLPEKVQIVDLPGIYSLSPYTPEEIISRNFILEEKPDCVINVVDATNLERNLYLTTQLLEIDVPVVIALNMMDAVYLNGDSIKVSEIENAFGVPVVEISALKNENTKKLMETAYAAAKKPRKGQSVLSLSGLNGLIEETRGLLEKDNISSPLFHAVKLLENDEKEAELHPEASIKVESIRKSYPDDEFEGDFEAIVADRRYKYITENFRNTVIRADKSNMTRSDKIDKVLTHKVWGIPIFLVIMFMVFHITFSEDFLFLNGLFGVEINAEWLCTVLQIEAGGGLPSLGVWLQSWMGWLTGGLIDLAAGWLENSPAWVSGLICDGLLSGLDAIFSFLPQILLLFLFLSILEDSGYMARVAFIMDRAFRKFGLSGKAFMPLLMCFGCGVPGVIATKTLENEKERNMTMMVAPFFSCGAKLPIWATFGALLFAGQYGDLVVFSMYLIGIAVAVIAAIILKNTALKGETPPFIMELPAYHRPQFKNTMIHLWGKLKHFLYKAATIIAGAVIVIWFLSSFGFDFWNGMVDIESSMLGQIGNVIKYIFYPLGFVSGEDGWKFAVAIVTGLIAKEMVIATMGTLSGMEDDPLELEITSDLPIAAMISTLSPAAAFSFMVFNLLSVPCMAMVAAVYGEMGSGKKTWAAIGFWLLTAYITSAAVYWYGTLISVCWWAALIAGIAVVAAVVTLAVLKSKGIIGKKIKKNRI